MCHHLRPVAEASRSLVADTIAGEDDVVRVAHPAASGGAEAAVAANHPDGWVVEVAAGLAGDNADVVAAGRGGVEAGGLHVEVVGLEAVAGLEVAVGLEVAGRRRGRSLRGRGRRRGGRRRRRTALTRAAEGALRPKHRSLPEDVLEKKCFFPHPNLNTTVISFRPTCLLGLK